MDPAGIESIDPSVVRSDKLVASVSDKRPDGTGDLDVRLLKKARGDSDGDMKRVAEIVLVLSAIGKMRGARSPTDVEKGLMAEAREKLGGMCEVLTPNDILPKDAVKVVIEDLGLNRSRDQMLGFRPPKMAIAEKLLLTKRKSEPDEAEFHIEDFHDLHHGGLDHDHDHGSDLNGPDMCHDLERWVVMRYTPSSFQYGECICTFDVFKVKRMEKSKEFAVHSATYSSQRLQAGFGATAETHVTSTTPLNQLPTNEVQSAIVSNGLSSSHLGRDASSLAFPRMETTHFRLDARSNGPSYALEVRANSSGAHPLEKVPSWSQQPQSASVAKVGQEYKVPDHTPFKVEGTPEMNTSQVALQTSRDQTSKSFIIQTASGSLPSVHQPLQGTNLVQTPSLYTNHADIARNVQKFLQPRLPEHPNWIPPSRDYMNKALTCQICKLTINDVESSLVCDACEKGVHLKCLQSYNQKGIPRGEWHCPKCLLSSNGKPLPPKYGRVTRNMSAPKVSSNTAGVQASSEKKIQNSDQKVIHPKITANGNPGLQNPAHVGSTSSSQIEPAADIMMPNAREIQGANFLASGIQMEDKDDGPYCGTCPNNSRETSGTVLVSSLSGEPNEKSTQHIQISESSPCEGRSISELKSQSPAKPSDKVIGIGHSSQTPCNRQDVDRTGSLNCAEVSSKQYHVNKPAFEDSENNSRETVDCKPRYDIKRDNQDVAQASSVGTSGIGNGANDCSRSSSDGLHCLDWIGDILQVVDEKTFYQSCCINGVVYKLQDHALLRSNNGNLTPSKLQVYESNHDSTVMAGLILGPCEVLPPNKFKEESQRRIHLGHEANDGLQPVFLCKWFYDESKGLFRPVTD
ncbi:hypothetical protein HHK36_005722 [Tetracentron sinense]|uniref:RING/FYVE/PHD zinc finger superfamily protein n=1 Tax=Tetracentron sinense TaxID=13715 RepID=A0A834ZLI3_TETSI|nr:hypothetical protein HHK36_005722 [Tetracentron sinense]